MTYHIAVGDQQRGPYTLDELWRVDFEPDTLVWHEGMPDWQRADSIADLRVILAGRMPATDGKAPGQEEEPEPDVFEVKIPDEPQRVQPVTVYPGAMAAQYGHQQQQPFAPGSSLGYAGRMGGPPPVAAAVTSMVLGIIALLLSFFALCLWFFSGPLALAAVITGHIAHSGARRGASGGAGMALTGLICGYCALALTAFFMLAFFGAILGG